MNAQAAASTEVVTIGCRLPNGIILEVGLQTTIKGGPHNRPIEKIKRLGNYRRIGLRGVNGHSLAMRRAGIQTPAVANPEPFLNRNIPKDAWEEWKRKHSDSPLLARGDLFEVKDVKDERAMVIDAMAKPAMLAPLDMTKPMKIGTNGETIETADFKD
jgi:hypothetical protein